MSAIIFGTVVEMKQISTNDRLQRKKYMGLWSLDSEITARMMSRFPSTVTRYIDRNSPRMMGWNSGSVEISMRWNSVTLVRLSTSTLLAQLLKENSLEK
jgi:hypothetical protein